MRKYLISIVLIGLFTSCNNDNIHPVPDIPIYLDYQICLSDIEYFTLKDVFGSVVLLNEGYLENGIVIVNVGSNEFKAYDATCPYEVKAGCSVLPDESSISLLKCECCGSKFELSFGAVNQGPANYALKTYKTVMDGECIRVYN